MRRILWLSCVLLCFATSASPQDAAPPAAVSVEELLEKAVAAYQAGLDGERRDTRLEGFRRAELFFAQFAELAAEGDCNVSWTALLAGMLGPGSHRSFLEQSHTLQDQGHQVFPQVTCRPLNFEFPLEEPFPLESIECFGDISRADHDGKMRIYADPEFRRAFKEAVTSGGFLFGDRWAATFISYCPSDTGLEEANLQAEANSRGVHPIDLMLDLGLANNLKSRYRMGIMNTDEEEVEECLQDPCAVLGLSDAGAHASQLCDA